MDTKKEDTKEEKKKNPRRTLAQKMEQEKLLLFSAAADLIKNIHRIQESTPDPDAKGKRSRIKTK